jgi:hypothetical protein
VVTLHCGRRRSEVGCTATVLGHGIDQADQKIAGLGLGAPVVYIIVARKMRLIVVEHKDTVGAFRDSDDCGKISNAILMTYVIT